MANRSVGDAALSDLRSSLARDIAGLAEPSFARGPSRARNVTRADPHPPTGNLNGGVDLLDDERRMSLLASEIKRLII